MNKRKNKESTLLLTKEQAGASRKWFVLDAKGRTLGRFASEVAVILRGKHKTTYTPHVDGGDGVIIINAEHICVTGNKEVQKKLYLQHWICRWFKRDPIKRNERKKTPIYPRARNQRNDARQPTNKPTA